MSIGAKTPTEIAVSILAQIIDEKNKRIAQIRPNTTVSTGTLCHGPLRGKIN